MSFGESSIVRSPGVAPCRSRTACTSDGTQLLQQALWPTQGDPRLKRIVGVDLHEYVAAIYDALYRGREDFVYRMTVGELPFVTGIFPLGGPAGATTTVELKGWNLPETKLTVDNTHRSPGVYPVPAGKQQWVSNVVPFAVDTLPECLEQEPNDSPATAQQVTLPIIVNGRIDRPGDRDLFRFRTPRRRGDRGGMSCGGSIPRWTACLR